MENSEEERPLLNPFSAVLSLITFMFLGRIVAEFIALVLVMPFIVTDFSNPDAVLEMMSNATAHPEMRLPLLLIQGIASFVGFILVPYFYIKFYKIDFYDLTGYNQKMTPQLTGMAVLIVVMVFPFVSALNQWNSQIDYSFISQDFYEWAKSQEKQLMEITVFMLKMDSWVDLLLSIIIIALIPAIGEELLFRGLLQTQMAFLVKKIHVAIWISAFIFSAIHLQIDGLFARTVLGAIFGYLYFWTGSLWYPILAHFINNGAQVVVAFIYPEYLTMEQDVEIPIYLAILSLGIAVFLLINFKKSYKLHKEKSVG